MIKVIFVTTKRAPVNLKNREYHFNTNNHERAREVAQVMLKREMGELVKYYSPVLSMEIEVYNV